jgi:hypothetical protein
LRHLLRSFQFDVGHHNGATMGSDGFAKTATQQAGAAGNHNDLVT